MIPLHPIPTHHYFRKTTSSQLPFNGPPSDETISGEMFDGCETLFVPFNDCGGEWRSFGSSSRESWLPPLNHRLIGDVLLDLRFPLSVKSEEPKHSTEGSNSAYFINSLRPSRRKGTTYLQIATWRPIFIWVIGDSSASTWILDNKSHLGVKKHKWLVRFAK